MVTGHWELEESLRDRVRGQFALVRNRFPGETGIILRYFRAYVFSLWVVATSVSQADTVTYAYDTLGRLTEVRHSDGSTVTYTLDPAGNRTQVATSTPPGA
ncbi:MAG: RHS repeat protein, partial [Steroidobacteraceae bacterium]|nr:RHS repeat protein [Steroidobacteraceae bacterium]